MLSLIHIYCALMAVREIRDYLENGNIVHSVNFPDCSMGACMTAGRIGILHKNESGMLSHFTTCLLYTSHVLGMVRQWQDLFYEKRYSATVLDDGVDYVKLAEAMGATGYRATTREAFNEALKAALAAKTPVVIDCVIGCDDKVWPMVAPGADISTAFTGEDLAAAQS